MSEWDGRPPGEAATRSGWHWIESLTTGNAMCAEWEASRGGWNLYRSTGEYHAPAEMFSWRYLGPCLTPAEVAAAVAAERDACAALCEGSIEVAGNPSLLAAIRDQVAQLVLADRIRARASGGDALAEHTARVRREALEEAARVLRMIRAAILNENGLNEGVLTDVLWASDHETVVDLIDATLIGGDDAAG